MKILTVHNKYKIRGGEDECREAEAELMASRGHETRAVVFDNDEITPLSAVWTGLQTPWRHSSYKRVLADIRSWRPDIVSVHNFFPVASPAVYYAARECRVPVVQTLHNYRLLCPNAMFFRDGHVCEECLGKRMPWPGVLHGCYRGSRGASAGVASMLTIHNVLGTWKTHVDMFIALSEFAKKKYVQGGLPADRITVKPNFVMSDPGLGEGSGNYVLYVGRLTEDKGIRILIEAWKQSRCAGRLVIAGDGQLASFVEQESAGTPSIQYLGRRPMNEIYELLGNASALVFPSIWYEGMPRVIIEAFSRGTPVIASRIGSMTEMVTEGRNGWLVEPGDATGIAEAVRNVFSAGVTMSEIRTAARREFENKYTAGRNYDFLVQIYERVLGTSNGIGNAPTGILCAPGRGRAGDSSV